PHYQAVRPAGEATVRDEPDRVTEPLADDGAGGREHLAHAWTALRPLVPDDDHVARLDAVLEDGGKARLLALEHPRRSGDARPFQARRLGDRALGREVAAQHVQV